MAGNPGHGQLRQRIAQLAAQLMSEAGIRDYALAKRKAARQLGVASPQPLPSNDEVDAALLEYRALFEPEAHQRDLRALRAEALEVMRALARFEPILTGGTVTGAISPHSEIEIELYSDSSKDFERYLLNEEIAFKTEERPGMSLYLLYAEPADVLVRVLPPQSLHGRRGGRDDARKRVTVTQLAQLLAQDTDTTGAQGQVDA
jgi:hypothetical protein